MTAAVSLPVFRNVHLSVSRIKRFEQCPLAFHYQYVDKPEAFAGEAGKSGPAEFGTVLHDALERCYRRILEDEYEGLFPEAELLEDYRMAWSESGLAGISLYGEGRDMLRRYASDAGHVDHMRTLAVEQEFNLLLGPGVCRLVDESEKPRWAATPGHYVVNGFIDRVDRVDAETVLILDYKSNRFLFSPGELEDDLQMSVYSVASRLLWPWAKGVDLAFQMLRHGIRQTTRRTDEDLAVAKEYVLSLGERTERGPYEPRLNTYCGTCEHRVRCDAYKSAVERKLEVVKVSSDDLTALAMERERVAKIAKAAYARKETLDAILRDAIGDADSLELSGTVYRLLQYQDTDHPVPEIQKLFDEVGVNLLPALRIDNKALDAVIDEVEKDEGQPKMVRDLLRVRVAAKAVKIPQRPRIDARPKKKS